MDTGPPTVADIELAIQRYLQAHPHAVDTERGIREWWLRDVHPRSRVADVHAAIEHLVAAGRLAERGLPDGQRAYAVTAFVPVPDPRPLGPS